MGIKKLTPTSPARRYQTYLTRDELTPGAIPEKSLLEPKIRISGRNNDGRITVRRRGGGHKRFYRVIDFKRNKDGVPGRVTQIEYDPNRSSNIALVTYLDGEKAIHYRAGRFGSRKNDHQRRGSGHPAR